MADNVTLPGTGAVVAADDVSSVMYQYAKLASSESGSADLIGDLDHGSVRSLYVSPRPDMVQAQVNSAGLTTASTAYSIGDVLGTGWEFTNFAKATGGVGRILGATMNDYADIMTGATIYLASGSITFGTDNSAPSISDADSLKLLGVIPLAFQDLGGVRFASADSINVPFVCDGTSVFAYAVTTVATSTFFGAVTDLKLRLFAVRD